ncbi:acyloxyacyl hydrolase [Aliikangiella sp. G2MR2-5]|uniref:acyloxyacyl hydrolase n=1 Tax=Aliikangiella sp. G2MR2-5 TaxID=2788943 RepID=UPI0018AA4757|nr:acyloxyacyl hydrolase [Aliikangiella sp. G2MR2-5]
MQLKGALSGKRVAIIISLFLSLLSSMSQSANLMLSVGKGMNDTLIQSESISGAKQFSLGYVWDSNYQFESEFFGNSKLEYELYVTEISDQQKLKAIVFRPVLNFMGDTSRSYNWYWQFGLGLSYFDSRMLGPIEFSSKGQFATMLGIGVPLDNKQNHRLTLRYNHYSNAYLSTPNPGLDTLSLDWHMRL